MSQVRRDPIRGHWTIIAPERSRRPDEYRVEVVETNGDGRCPFCPGNESLTPPEIDSVRPAPSEADRPGWVVRLVPNQYPALATEVGSERMMLRASELQRAQPALGYQEIVVATPEHRRRAAHFTVDQWDTALAASQYRMERILDDRRIKQLLLFQNHGGAAGASRTHAHFQIMGLPMTSNTNARKLLNARDHFARYERCLFCDVLEQELSDSDRIVRTDESFVTFTPWASRLPFELCVMPRAHHASFLEVSGAERRRLGAHMRATLRGLESLFGDCPYNWVLHTVPAEEADPRHYHWHIEILPRLGSQGGYEWGTGGFINTTAPEEAAASLRAAAES